MDNNEKMEIILVEGHCCFGILLLEAEMLKLTEMREKGGRVGVQYIRKGHATFMQGLHKAVERLQAAMLLVWTL